MTHEDTFKKADELERAVQSAARKLYAAGNLEQHIADVHLKLHGIIEAGLLTHDEGAQIESEIRTSANLRNVDDFCKRITGTFSRLLQLQQEHPREMEAAARKAFAHECAFTPINDLLSYGREDGLIHIHLAPAKTLSVKEKIAAVRDGLTRLATIVHADESMKQIEATSWIVARHPKLMKKLGFTVTGPIDDGMRQRRFREETRPVSHAVINREEFLRRYFL